MTDSEALEFPFVEAMPKREKSRMTRLWEKLSELRDLTERNGSFVPLTFAAKLLGISRQRTDELVRLGRLERIDCDGHVFITERSIVAFAKSERKAGRPLKMPETLADCARVAWQATHPKK